MQYINLSSRNLHKKRSLRLLKRITPVLIIAGIIISIGIIRAIFSSHSSFDYAFKVPFIGYPFNTSDDKVNILLLGNAGGNHDGTYLTDTVMVASYNLKTKHVNFISLPRDLWLDEQKLKLNAVYETGEEKRQGLKFTKEVVGGVLGVPIHFAIRVDFRGFERAIDEVEGIEVDVEKTFDDYLYPITGKEEDLCGWGEEEREFNEEDAKNLGIEPGKRKVLIKDDKVATDSAEPEKGYEYFDCRYEHIHFDKGLTKMNGETALKYVRSRMGSNGEGNDFARSVRQQKVIESFRKKALSLETIFNPKKIRGLIGVFGQSIETDIPIDDMIELYKFSKQLESSSNFVIKSSGEGALLINPPQSDYGGAWVLVPRDGNFSEIKNYVKKILSGEIDEASNSARTGSN